MRHFFIVVLSILAISSCNVPKETIYFRENRKTDTTILTTELPPYRQSLVQPDDILAVQVSSISDFTTKDPVRIFNEGGIYYVLTPNINTGGGGGGNSGGGGANLKGYLVDADGYMDYPVIGKIKVAGLTLREVKNVLAQRLASDYIKDPVVEVRILNYKVTVLGEVRWPGVVIAPNHRMNVLEAVSAAGDITLAGRKDNVMIIREVNGKRQFARVDLGSRNAFTNPYFVLKQNDIVYIEASRAIRQTQNNAFINFYLPFINLFLGTGLSIYAISVLSSN